MARKSWSGNAAAAKLAAAMVDATVTTATLDSATNWPSTASYPFVAVVERGTTNEEKILVAARSGTALSSITRGWDSTTAVAHALGSAVEHVVDADTISGHDAHMYDTTRDDHTQYMKKALWTAKGSLLTASAAGTPSELLIGTDGYRVAASSTAAGGLVYVNPASRDGVTVNETTTSVTYAALATAGPAVTVTIGPSGRAKVTVAAKVSNSGANGTFMAFAISGASTVAASDDQAIANFATTAIQAGVATVVTGLTPGSTTFTAQYRVDAGTGTFYRRQLIVEPL